MRVPPLVYHPRYSCPTWPLGHRFAMSKFSDLAVALASQSLLPAGAIHRPAPLEHAAFEAVHDAALDGVGGVDVLYADGDRERRVERKHVFALCAPPPSDDLDTRMRNLLRRMMKIDTWLVTADSRLGAAEEEVAALAPGAAPLDRSPTKWQRPEWLPSSKGPRRNSVTEAPAVGMSWGD